MSDLEILVDYYKAIDAQHIIPTKLDPLDCGIVDCDACSFDNACSYMGDRELKDISTIYRYFKLRIKPFLVEESSRHSSIYWLYFIMYNYNS